MTTTLAPVHTLVAAGIDAAGLGRQMFNLDAHFVMAKVANVLVANIHLSLMNHITQPVRSCAMPLSRHRTLVLYCPVTAFLSRSWPQNALAI